MCQSKAGQKSSGARGYSCGCCGCGCGMFTRRFISAKEEQESLEEYRDQLKNEIAGVEEHIQELKSK